MSIHSPSREISETRPNDSSGWRPKVLDGDSNLTACPADLDLEEVWYWLNARLKALGGLEPGPARLAALLHWNPASLGKALHAARLEIDREEEGAARRAHLEFLAAEYVAREALDQETIPAPELHSA